MSSPEGEYYTEERWQNWIGRLTSEEIDLEDEESGRLLQNFQDDTVIAIAKIVTDYDDSEIDEETALSELSDVRDIVLTDVELDDDEDENTLMLVSAVQTALVCVFYAAEKYIVNEIPETDIEQYIQAARDAEAEEDYETALGHCAQAGASIIDGQEMAPSVGEEIEYGPVADWITGLRSLQVAMADPEVVEVEES